MRGSPLGSPDGARFNLTLRRGYRTLLMRRGERTGCSPYDWAGIAVPGEQAGCRRGHDHIVGGRDRALDLFYDRRFRLFSSQRCA